MSYDTLQFYNSTLAILAGAGAAALSFRLIPPLSPAFRTRRLLALTLVDLRRLASPPGSFSPGRISAMPGTAQRIPVRIHIDEVPEGVVLAAGMTATVQIDIPSRPTEPG
jgi:hypothetical protein